MLDNNLIFILQIIKIIKIIKISRYTYIYLHLNRKSLLQCIMKLHYEDDHASYPVHIFLFDLSFAESRNSKNKLFVLGHSKKERSLSSQVLTFPEYTDVHTRTHSFQRLRQKDINLSSRLPSRGITAGQDSHYSSSCVPQGLLVLHQSEGKDCGRQANEKGSGREGSTNTENPPVADCIRLRLHNSERYQVYDNTLAQLTLICTYIRDRCQSLNRNHV